MNGLRKALMLREIRFAPKMATDLEKKVKEEEYEKKKKQEWELATQLNLNLYLYLNPKCGK